MKLEGLITLPSGSVIDSKTGGKVVTDLVDIALRAPEERAARERAQALARQRAIAAIPKYALRAKMILAMTPEEFEVWAAAHPVDIARIRAAMEKRARRERQRYWLDWKSRVGSGKE